MAALTDRRVSVDVTANKTLTAADSGIVQNVIADGVVITLPSTVNGLNFIVRNGGVPVTGGAAGTGADGSAAINVTPQAADGVTGLGFTAAISKGALNAKATSRVGDEIALEGTGTAGAGAYVVMSAKGIWARQA